MSNRANSGGLFVLFVLLTVSMIFMIAKNQGSFAEAPDAVAPDAAVEAALDAKH